MFSGIFRGCSFFPEVGSRAPFDNFRLRAWFLKSSLNPRILNVDTCLIGWLSVAHNVRRGHLQGSKQWRQGIWAHCLGLISLLLIYVHPMVPVQRAAASAGGSWLPISPRDTWPCQPPRAVQYSAGGKGPKQDSTSARRPQAEWAADNQPAYGPPWLIKEAASCRPSTWKQAGVFFSLINKDVDLWY